MHCGAMLIIFADQDLAGNCLLAGNLGLVIKVLFSREMHHGLRYEKVM